MFFDYLLKKWIENRITVALQDHDLQGLKNWLMVATGKSDAGYWNYRFSTGKTVIQKLLMNSVEKHSAYRRGRKFYQFPSTPQKKCFSAQADIKFLLRC